MATQSRPLAVSDSRGVSVPKRARHRKTQKWMFIIYILQIRLPNKMYMRLQQGLSRSRMRQWAPLNNWWSVRTESKEVRAEGQFGFRIERGFVHASFVA